MNDINPKILQLLDSRGITQEADIAEFLSTKPKRTYDPFLLLNMEAGVDFILKAIKEQKSICLYGDYDVDGITSICILRLLFAHLTDKVTHYIPSRFSEGYGLNRCAIDKLKAKGVELIITVDCGSTSYDEVEYAKSIGLDIIVTDHHSIMDKKANCILINPKQEGCPYPFKGLAGCGVAFKLAQALRERTKLPKSVTNGLLDIVAIGTIGDIVPLIDENRTLAKYGLYELNKHDRLGIKLLVEAISMNSISLRSDQIAYCIVPHLNAAGRMKDAVIGVDLLLSNEPTRAKKLANELVLHNSERKRIQEETFLQCMELKEEQCKDSTFPIIRAENAHEGITGIVAGKLKDIYQKPVIIATPCEGLLKGTGRSTDKIDMFQILDKYRDLFIRFGGHHSACGFLMSEENFQEFKRNANTDLENRLQEEPDLLDQQSQFDLTLTGADLTLDFFEQLEMMEPFGCKNRRPIFCLHNVSLSNQQKMGKEGTHARFFAHTSDGTSAECVLFSKAIQNEELIYRTEFLNLYGTLQLNVWNGSKKIQFVVDRIEEYQKN
jgi:single-stranded-DNA-specific exonuclease